MDGYYFCRTTVFIQRVSGRNKRDWHYFEIKDGEIEYFNLRVHPIFSAKATPLGRDHHAEKDMKLQTHVQVVKFASITVHKTSLFQGNLSK